MNISKKNILFKCETDSGKYAGTGHLKRSIQVLGMIKRKFKSRFNYIFLFKKLNHTENILKKNLSEKFIIYKNNLEKKLNFLKPNDIIINDTPKGLGNNFSKILFKKNIKKIIVFDDIKKYKNSNITYINSISFFKKKISGSNVFQGTKYLLINRKNKNKNKNKRNKDLKILISTGGADYKNILQKIILLIKDIENLNLTVLIGSGVKSNNPIFKIKKKNIKILKNVKNVENLFEKNDISIITGGLIMFESLAFKKITYVYQSYFHQSYAIKELVKKKLIIKIGENKKIFKKKILSLLNKNIKDKQAGKKFTNDKSYVDTKGYLRIKKIIYNCLNDKKN
jgi:spore coat polysaccharide biosynthesis predicted glycosyltransferase SpsG